MKGTVRVGVVGAGSMAKRVHLPSLTEIEGAEVVAICDIVPERAQELAQTFSIPGVYTLQREMLEKESLDATVALVEPGSLYHVVRLCLEAGLPTFMEKPPGITLFQARSLARLSAEKKALLMVGFNRRYIPLVQKVKGIIGDRATVTQVEGRFMKEGDAAFDRGSVSAYESDTIHCVDLVRWLAGYGENADGPEVRQAATVMSQQNEVVPNMWNSVFQFHNNVTGTIRANYQTGGRIHNFEIHGPGASAFINLGFGGFGCDARVLFGTGGAGYSLAATGAVKLDLQELDGMELAGSEEFHKYYGFYQEEEEFIRCVQEDRVPMTCIADAVKTFELVDLLRRSEI
jgi:predicted dehydrogenase